MKELESFRGHRKDVTCMEALVVHYRFLNLPEECINLFTLLSVLKIAISDWST